MKAPWPDARQIEQDLIISRALCDLFNTPMLKDKIAFRGGTAINKLLFKQPLRYSEDIDLMQTQAESIGTTVDAIREALSSSNWRKPRKRTSRSFLSRSRKLTCIRSCKCWCSNSYWNRLANRQRAPSNPASRKAGRPYTDCCDDPFAKPDCMGLSTASGGYALASLRREWGDSIGIGQRTHRRARAQAEDAGQDQSLSGCDPLRTAVRQQIQGWVAKLQAEIVPWIQIIFPGKVSGPEFPQRFQENFSLGKCPSGFFHRNGVASIICKQSNLLNLIERSPQIGRNQTGLYQMFSKRSN